MSFPFHPSSFGPSNNIWRREATKHTRTGSSHVSDSLNDKRNIWDTIWNSYCLDSVSCDIVILNILFRYSLSSVAIFPEYFLFLISLAIWMIHTAVPCFCYLVQVSRLDSTALPSLAALTNYEAIWKSFFFIRWIVSDLKILTECHSELKTPHIYNWHWTIGIVCGTK